VPLLILHEDDPLRALGPRAVHFVDCVTVGRDPSSHWVTGPAQTHVRHFAIVHVGADYVIYDHDDACGTFLDDGASLPTRLRGRVVRLRSGTAIQANRISFEFIDTQAQRVIRLPRAVTRAVGWSWARRPEEIRV